MNETRIPYGWNNTHKEANKPRKTLQRKERLSLSATHCRLLLRHPDQELHTYPTNIQVYSRPR